ncbi:MAG: complex I NDUFA9 subunit family protein [Hyphomicrobiaceae bacterium]|nr:complex I NDUFA9 subunit family protein [Hyphomicrobiaceae bacterium]
MSSSLVLGGLVTVFGGSGFVGRHAVQPLARRGWRIRAAVRRPDLAGHLQPMGRLGQIHAVQANVRYPDSVAHAVRDAVAVVNAVGILSPTSRQSFSAVHVAGARAIARAAREAGARRLVHVSAIGADPRSRSAYARTKAQSERAVLEEFPDAIIIRPSVVFGPEDDFFNRFAAMARFGLFLPLIGGGRTRFQPVYAADLGNAIANAVEGGGGPGTVYEAGGPEVFTFRELLDRTQMWTDHRRPYVSIPFWLASLLGILMWPLPNSLRPFTLDQVRLLKSDNVVSDAAQHEGRTLEGLGVSSLHTIEAIVPTYLERFRPHGQFARYRG